MLGGGWGGGWGGLQGKKLERVECAGVQGLSEGFINESRCLALWTCRVADGDGGDGALHSLDGYHSLPSSYLSAATGLPVGREQEREGKVKQAREGGASWLHQGPEYGGLLTLVRKKKNTSGETKKSKLWAFLPPSFPFPPSPLWLISTPACADWLDCLRNIIPLTSRFEKSALSLPLIFL